MTTPDVAGRPATWRELTDRAADTLRAAGIDTADMEARWLMEEVSGLDRAELTVEADELAPDRTVPILDALVERRAAGEPLQYVLGHWDFHGLDLAVDPRVLIPRPETEVVAEVAISELERIGERRGRSDAWSGALTNFTVADLGTGSGALALALAAELPDAAVWATDRSEAALAIARANLAGAGQPAVRVRLGEGSWFEALPEDLRGGLRLVVSNPPYVAESEYPDLPPEVRDYEPYDALVSGPSGLESIATIVEQAPDWLEPGGVLVLELAPHQVESARSLAAAAGFADVEIRKDLSGRERVLVARRSPGG
ncbi:MAG: protein-(glutamine-N5) methyltransferase, release factor-specific [Actinomycetia bacterium]|nr:protein-(glutamine-N5) methyltransferase, release factor-specific [Actinomycetes bacterium]